MVGRAIAAAVTAAFLAASCDTSSSTTPAHNVVLRSPVRSAADLTCSLPVIIAGQYGFVDFPSGRFRKDPHQPPPAGNVFYAYSHGAHRWVITTSVFGSAWISPDGTKIAEIGPHDSHGTVDLLLIDVTTHMQKRVGTIPAAQVIAYRPEGIYLAQGYYVYRFDLGTGKEELIGPKSGDLSMVTSGWFWVTSSAVWSSRIAGPNQGDQTNVVSMSRRDGSLSLWYTAPMKRSVSILGFVMPDEPLVAEYNAEPYDRMTGVEFRLLTRPGMVQTLDLDPSIKAWGFTDAFGIWLLSPGHVWLYDTAGITSMGTLPLDISGTANPDVAGPCE